MKRASHPRRGAAAVELAVVLPFLVMLLLGIWEIGRLTETRQVLANAAREGGRQASRGDLDNTNITARVQRYLNNNGINSAGATVQLVRINADGSTTTIDMTDSTVLQLDRLRVTVTIPFDNVRWAALNYFAPAGSMVSGTADWRCMKDVPVTVNTTLPVPN